jgi:hypothetical protein
MTLFAARVSSGFCLGERGNRRYRSSFGPQGVKSRGPIMRCQKAQVAKDPRNVSDKPEFGAVPHPTDRPHLAAFILPS